MAKASIPGRAKTRLVPPLTPAEAASLNTSFLRDVADNLIGASALANIAGFMAHAPAGSARFFRDTLPDRIGLIETVDRSATACSMRRHLLAAGRRHLSCSSSEHAAHCLQCRLAAPGNRTCRTLDHGGDIFG
jgi:hypothetical protein